MRPVLLRRCLASILLGLAIAAASSFGPRPAAAEDPFKASLASNLLKARAQLRIYRHDDQMDRNCQERSFTDAEVVALPKVVNKELDERKWVETWVLNRCGADVPYHVFFTLVGDGGAYFAFKPIQ